MKKLILVIFAIMFLCSCTQSRADKIEENSDDVLYGLETQIVDGKKEEDSDADKDETEIIQLPDFQGKHIDDVMKIADELEIKVEVEDEQFDTELTDGSVIRQKPLPYKEVEKGSVVKVTITSLKQKYEIDDYVGMSCDTAQNILKNMGVEVEIIYENSTIVDKGIVIRQSPAGKGKITEDDRVYLFVSNGSETTNITVPNFSMMSLESAKSLLDSLDLELGEIYYENSGTYSGLIIGQSLPAGTQVESGTVIDFIVGEE